MTTSYFGRPWDEPMRDRDAQEVATPVGAICRGCRELIVEGDRGVLQPHFDGIVTTTPPIHMECKLLSEVGHIYGVCACTGYANSRSDALELIRRINHHRRRIGLREL